jgi:hypothetical protein
MMGTLTAPTSARMAPALSARRGSSIAACSAMKPRYRKNSTSSDVSRASHTHQVPHIGLPQKAPVHSDRKAISAPVGASACAIMADSRVFSARPMPAHAAITR